MYIHTFLKNMRKDAHLMKSSHSYLKRKYLESINDWKPIVDVNVKYFC